jgi:hypothetical protein
MAAQPPVLTVRKTFPRPEPPDVAAFLGVQPV